MTIPKGYELEDAQWTESKDTALNAILWPMRSVVPWRGLPETMALGKRCIVASELG
jgi:hypothetical protein